MVKELFLVKGRGDQWLWGINTESLESREVSLPSYRETRVKPEVARRVLWCISYKQPGWDGNGDEDREKRDGGKQELRDLLWQMLVPLMRLGLFCSLMPPISSN